MEAEDLFKTKTSKNDLTKRLNGALARRFQPLIIFLNHLFREAKGKRNIELIAKIMGK
jgi:hypothetical protein